MGKLSLLEKSKPSGPSPENVSTMKVELQYLFISLYEDNTQSHPTRMKYNVSLTFQ